MGGSRTSARRGYLAESLGFRGLGFWGLGGYLTEGSMGITTAIFSTHFFGPPALGICGLGASFLRHFQVGSSRSRSLKEGLYTL